MILTVTLAGAATAAVLAWPSAASSPATTIDTAPRAPVGLSGDEGAQHPLVEGDGRVADGVTVFDDGVAAVANLDADLLAALRRAATDASRDGVTFTVNSGWRSPEYQDDLLRDAVAQYGSAAEAARWVATAETSPHVQGDAIDIGPWDAADWLSQHGAGYGLCQIYANEAWHFELRVSAVGDGCPAMYPDPTYDPRMQK